MLIFRKGLVKLIIDVTPLPIKKLIHQIYPSLKVHGDFGQSLMSIQRLEFMLRLLKETAISDNKDGIIECGCYKGGATVRMAKVLKNLDSKKIIYALDTFEGHPYLDGKNGKTGMDWSSEFTSNSLEEVRKLMKKEGVSDKVSLHKGLFIDTFKKMKNYKFCFALVDADIYLSTKECIKFLLPRMVKGGVIFFDDYGTKDAWGIEEAIKETLGLVNVIKNKKLAYAYYIKK